MGSVCAPAPVPSYKYIPLSGFQVQTVANGSIDEVINATIDELGFDCDATNAAYSGEIEIAVQLPADFKAFAGQSDDVSVQAIQDADSGDGVGDLGISLDVTDSSGTAADDGSVANTALTGSFATYDCAITAGSFAAGDWIVVKISILEKGTNENGDGAIVSLPKIKYIPQ